MLGIQHRDRGRYVVAHSEEEPRELGYQGGREAMSALEPFLADLQRGRLHKVRRQRFRRATAEPGGAAGVGGGALDAGERSGSRPSRNWRHISGTSPACWARNQATIRRSSSRERRAAAGFVSRRRRRCRRGEPNPPVFGDAPFRRAGPGGEHGLSVSAPHPRARTEIVTPVRIIRASFLLAALGVLAALAWRVAGNIAWVPTS